MGLSGLIGTGAAAGLDEVLAQQLERAMFEEQQRQFNERQRRDAEQLQEQQRRALEQEALARRRADQDDAQFVVSKERAAVADTRANEEMQQEGIDATRAERERQRVNLTRLQNEADLDDVVAGADPITRRVVQLRRAGVNAGRGDVLSPSERQAELNAETNADIRQDRARQQAEQEFSERQATGRTLAIDAAKAEQIDTANEAKRLAMELKNHPGLKGVFGILDARLPTFRQDTANAEEIHNSLTSLLTLENTGKLKGVLSNADMQILRQASTMLSQRVSEATAKKELGRIIEVMGRVGSWQSPLLEPSHESRDTEIYYDRSKNGKLRPRR